MTFCTHCLPSLERGEARVGLDVRAGVHAGVPAAHRLSEIAAVRAEGEGEGVLGAPGRSALVLLPYYYVVGEVEREAEEAPVISPPGNRGADPDPVVEHPEAVVIALESLPREHAEEIADDSGGLLVGQLLRRLSGGLFHRGRGLRGLCLGLFRRRSLRGRGFCPRGAGAVSAFPGILRGGSAAAPLGALAA